MEQVQDSHEVLDALERVGAFRSLPDDAFQLILHKAHRRRFEAGQILMRQGDPSDCMFVILSGEVSVQRAHPHVVEGIHLTELGSGNVVGEVGLLDGEPRSATVVATRRTDTLELDSLLLERLLLDFPQVSNGLVSTLNRRLRSTFDLAEHYARHRES